MNLRLYDHCRDIVDAAITAVLPEQAVERALSGLQLTGSVTVVSVGKAAYRMAKAAVAHLPDGAELKGGIIITKYDHLGEPVPGLAAWEAGHPVPDDNSAAATEAALALTADLTAEDTVLFLLSGGGSALFEKPFVPLSEMQDITRQLLGSGADITEINTIRKRLSGVKGGRFAQHCAPAHVEAIVLSDVLGDPLDMIASGPAAPDKSTCADALAIAEKYQLALTDKARALLQEETPKELTNVHTQVVGSVRELCRAAMARCEALGYESVLLTDRLNCEAREAGRFMAAIAASRIEEMSAKAGSGEMAESAGEARSAGDATAPAGQGSAAGGSAPGTRRGYAYLVGGETVVHLTGKGLGGRNQEFALAAAEGLSGLNAALISVGSDGTDGPTDAAGGYADGDTAAALAERGLRIHEVLQENDAYHALHAVGGLVMTGPTGTNVNDVAILLVEAGSSIPATTRRWR